MGALSVQVANRGRTVQSVEPTHTVERGACCAYSVTQPTYTGPVLLLCALQGAQEIETLLARGGIEPFVAGQRSLNILVWL